MTAATATALAARDDVVMRKGRYTLLTSATPQAAVAEDLLALGAALDDAGIGFLLVRRDDARFVIAVDRAERRRLSAALAEAFVDEPFYVRGPGGEPALVSEGGFDAAPEARAFRVFRPRTTATGRVRYGAASGVRLELWEFGVDEIVAPSSNSLMRRTLPRSEAVEATVDLLGREWRTLDGMFATHASDIDFEIDIVFSWVDGSSTEYQRQRAEQMKTYVVGDGDDSEARYRQIDELKYALRSVYMYAPWIRRIFIATDSPAPSWLAEHPRVTIVRSEEFFDDPEALPTHNSHAVESQLHKIEGLSEHFLYSNDDMFFGRAVSPGMFFSPGGITKFIEATTRIGLGDADARRSGHDNAARVNRAVLHSRFGRITTRHLEHTATPLRRSVMRQMEQEFPDDFARTARSRFRSATDISVTNSFYHYYALMSGKAVTQERAKVVYVETTLKRASGQMKEIARTRGYDFFCLNDGSKPEISVEERTRDVTRFLDDYFPVAAPWEVTPER